MEVTLCPNMAGARDEAICRRCFWAFPENYDHIATKQIRRVDVIWQGGEVSIHDKLRRQAQAGKTTVAEILKTLARQKAKEG